MSSKVMDKMAVELNDIRCQLSITLRQVESLATTMRRFGRMKDTRGGMQRDPTETSSSSFAFNRSVSRADSSDEHCAPMRRPRLISLSPAVSTESPLPGFNGSTVQVVFKEELNLHRLGASGNAPVAGANVPARDSGDEHDILRRPRPRVMSDGPPAMLGSPQTSRSNMSKTGSGDISSRRGSGDIVSRIARRAPLIQSNSSPWIPYATDLEAGRGGDVWGSSGETGIIKPRSDFGSKGGGGPTSGSGAESDPNIIAVEKEASGPDVAANPSSPPSQDSQLEQKPPSTKDVAAASSRNTTLNAPKSELPTAPPLPSPLNKLTLNAMFHNLFVPKYTDGGSVERLASPPPAAREVTGRWQFRGMHPRSAFR
ncbi:hypothetical protein BDK51DRAFT_51148, partial [Blyttiomyces helicus]